MTTTVQERFEGAYLGVAIGDAIGCPYETKTAKKIAEMVGDNRLVLRDYVDPFCNEQITLPAGFWSDDTAMTRALADSLVEKDFDPEDQFARYKSWLDQGKYVPEVAGRQHIGFGAGKRTKDILHNPAGFRPEMLTTEDPTALGTGGLMRTSPIALRYQGQPEKIWEYARLASAVTHNSQESMDACGAYCLILDNLLAGEEKHEALNNFKSSQYFNLLHPLIAGIVATDYAKLQPKDFLPENFQEGKANSFLVQHALSIALWSWITSNNYEENITKAVRLGQDTDTYAAITGALAGATYGLSGIPKDWLEGIQSADQLQNDVRKLMQANNLLV